MPEAMLLANGTAVVTPALQHRISVGGTVQSARTVAIGCTHRQMSKSMMSGRSLRNTHKVLAKLVQAASATVNSSAFAAFMVLWIVVASVIIGIQTYPQSEKEYRTLDAINWVVTAFFTLEIILKLIAQGSKPWRFFTGHERGWNWFDFIIVLACYVDFHVDTKQLRLIRFVRVMRIAKLVREVPQLRVVVQGLIGGLRKIVYIMLMLTLVYYMYAIFGMTLYAENDPFFFGALHRAVLCLFKSSTMEDWMDVMYINMWGCDKWPHLIYVSPGTADRDKVFWCSHPTEQRSAALYFVSFMIIAALVLMSLVVGAIIMAMEVTISEMREETEEKMKKRRFAQKMKTAEKLACLSNTAASTSEPPMLVQAVCLNTPHKFDSTATLKDGRVTFNLPSPHSRLKVPKDEAPDALERADTVAALLHTDETRELHARSFKKKQERHNMILQALMTRAWSGMDVTKLQEEQFYFDHPNRFVRVYARLSHLCERIESNSLFTYCITLAILAAGVVIGAQTFHDLSSSMLHDLQNAEIVIASIFTFEVCVKLISEEFEPWVFFKSKWNIFDFIVVIGSILSLGEKNGSNSVQSEMFMLLRLVRLFRILKLIKQLPYLQVIVQAVLKSLHSIISLGSIIFLFDYMYAIIGTTFFSENDPLRYGSLHTSMLTMFQVSTREDWSYPMFINAYGCDQLGYEEWPWLCTQPSRQYLFSICYHVIFIVICALVLLTLFIGVVTTTMENEGSALRQQEKVNKRVQLIQERYQLTNRCIKMYRDVFDFLDMDGGGTIGEEELDMGLKSIGKHLSRAELETLFTKVDVDRSGEIDVSELIDCMALLRFHGQEADRRLAVHASKFRDQFLRLKRKAKKQIELAVEKVEVARKSSMDTARRLSQVGKRLSSDGTFTQKTATMLPLTKGPSPYRKVNVSSQSPSTTRKCKPQENAQRHVKLSTIHVESSEKSRPNCQLVYPESVLTGRPESSESEIHPLHEDLVMTTVSAPKNKISIDSFEDNTCNPSPGVSRSVTSMDSEEKEYDRIYTDEKIHKLPKEHQLEPSITMFVRKISKN